MLVGLRIRLSKCQVENIWNWAIIGTQNVNRISFVNVRDCS